MNADCFPVTALPHVSPLFRDYVSGLGEDRAHGLQPFYSPFHRGNQWMQHPAALDRDRRVEIATLLREQNRLLGAGPAAAANLDRLAAGAGAVVTGQQVGLFGGPLLTLLKAATAIRLAEDASRSGHPHVPIFWLASEDHDFDEVNQVTFPCGDARKSTFESFRLPENPGSGMPVGNLPLGDAILPLVEGLRRCLGTNPVSELLASVYTPAATFSSAFAAFITRIFSEHGLIVIDASARPFHALANTTLRAAIEQADEIHAALLERSKELERAGYHAQVMVSDSSSLLFLIDTATGVRTALKKVPGGAWSAGSKKYTTAELLAIVEEAPERISPNVLLRPVMQDTLLPTSVYIGGPAEIAYFAQSEVVYGRILGHATPVLPRFSATLVEPDIARMLERHQLSLPDVFASSDALAQKLAARAMPVEGKRKLSAAGNALDSELKTLTAWMHVQDQGLGHAADIAASKMLYQMNRLRRLSAAFTLQREQSIRRHAEALCHDLFPHENLQERVLAGAWFLSRSRTPLPDLLIANAQAGHCAHRVLYL